MAPSRIDRVLGFEHGLPPGYGWIAAGVGILFLLFGWRLHRLTLVLAGFLVGAFAGQLVARWIQVDRAWGVFVGGGAMAMLAEPLHRVTVFLVAGAVLGLGLGEAARSLAGPGSFWFGFVPAFVLGGLASVWKMRLVIVVSTALLGCVLFCWGAAVAVCNLGLPRLCTFHRHHPWATLAVITLVGLIGCVVQWRLARETPHDTSRDGEV